jgi:hypothetical protein
VALDANDDLLSPNKSQFVPAASFDAPLLTVTVDTEEEFDWDAPFSRANTKVGAIKHLHLASSIFARFGVVPTYVVDYPIVESDEAWDVIQKIVDDGAGIIGTQLHPWVTPPHVGELNAYNSYPGNLPKELEAQKIQQMTDGLRDRMGVAPVIYKAGRYGVGPNTSKTLADQGYLIDMSVRAHRDYSSSSGPDFLAVPPVPYWFNGGRLLEIPLTAGFLGIWRGRGAPMYRRITTPRAQSLRLPGIWSQLNLMNRVTLTPEGAPIGEAIALTKELLSCGHKVFSLAFHSTSLEAGNTSYVRNSADLAALLKWLETYLEFFLGAVGGRAVTPLEILALARAGNSAPQPGGAFLS